MTKKEIIEVIASTDVPPGSKLVEHKIGGLMMSRHAGASAEGGIKLILARQLVEELTAETVEFPDTPSADLLQRIHEAFHNYNKNMLICSTMETLDEEIKLIHCQMILRLQDISQRLGIPYEEPEDTILT